MVARLPARAAEAAVVDDEHGEAVFGKGGSKLVEAHFFLGTDPVGHDDDGGSRGGAVKGSLWSVEPGLALFCCLGLVEA